MADEPNQGGSGLSNYFLPTILAMLALAGGYSWLSPRLNSLRPTVGWQDRADITRPQAIEARLWQDPLAAVERARRDALAKGADSKEKRNPQVLNADGMREMLHDDDENSPPDPDHVAGLHVILAMIPDGSYSEDTEFRLRSREAVVTALSAAYYRAEDEERIGAWSVPWPKDIDRIPDDVAPSQSRFYHPLAAGAPEAVFPFERFRIRRHIDRIGGSPDLALVVWLPDGLFDGAPLERLSLLVNAVRDLRRGLPGEPIIDILGPTNSSMLRDMLPREVKPVPRVVRAERPLQGVHMFSWAATAMDEMLEKDWQRAWGTRVQVKKSMRHRWGLHFTSTIATDDELSGELVDELARRGVNLARETDHVALLYEWDTFYARTLPNAFTAEVRRRQRKPPDANKAAGLRDAVTDVLRWPMFAGRASSIVPNVHVFTYLRGIDGRMPGEETDKKAAATEKGDAGGAAKNQDKESRAAANQAEGANQLDYIPRAALDLDRLCHDLEEGADPKDAGTGKLKAIGLMGSDFYDKLLILQALRDHFPGIIFFTTDLDGRYLDPDVKKWTRNLVVASAFGLNLRRDYQGSAAPFRSSYQTSLYLAALEALWVIPPEHQAGAPPPRLFEIGRVHAVDLSTSGNKYHLQPEAGRGIYLGGAFWSVVLVVIMLGLLITFVPALRNMFLPYERLSARQVPLFFTENDILEPEQAISILEPSPPTKQEEKNPAGPLSLREMRIKVMNRLNDRLRNQEEYPRPLPASPVDTLLGPYAPGASACFMDLPRQTVRLAARRREMEGLLGKTVGSHEPRCRSLDDQAKNVPLGIAVGGFVCLVFLGLLLFSHVNPGGEPFSLFEGVSVWPCECLRMLAIISAVVFVFKARMDLRMGEVGISEDYFLAREHRRSSRLEGVESARKYLLAHPGRTRVRAWLAYLWRLPTKYPAIPWYSLPGPVDAQRLWDAYRDRGRALPRLVRSLWQLLAIVIFYLSIIVLSKPLIVGPARGGVAHWVDIGLLILIIASFLYLNLLVADAVRLARTFIRHLTRGDTQWPRRTLKAERERTGADDDDDVIEWLDIQFVGQLTRRVANLVYYPAIVLCLLIVARTHYFDDWHWPWALVLIFAVNSSWPLVSAFLLQAAATEAREVAMEKLGVRIAAAKVAKRTPEQIKKLEELQKLVADYREGAFTKYLDNPALKALLVPCTGAGIVNLVNLLTSG